MTTRLKPADELAQCVEGFEAAAVADPVADLGAILPAADHPLYLPVLAELIRVDLEGANARRDSRRLCADARFPSLVARSDVDRDLSIRRTNPLTPHAERRNKAWGRFHRSSPKTNELRTGCRGPFRRYSTARQPTPDFPTCSTYL